MATLRDIQKQHTRQLLLDNALEMFTVKGYAATTIDDIAAAAGTTRTTFYAHFPSKSQLMSELIRGVDDILTGADEPVLETVVEVGSRDLIEKWLDRKLTQWEVIRPYMLIAYQAAPEEPDVQETIDKWFADTTESMQQGLTRAGRHSEEDRRVRCILAFGQLEFMSQLWFRSGWVTPRQVCLSTLTDSWMYLVGRVSAD
ncbi:TetR/AcrR family transcriptional regulator [Gordonia sp. CPCC 206044]|uniref:TetR/AcrR family transcriptional regulator n=1 Tax=Gordonia sp. CPCC 206044 TaxID=3140793 RepID=UPI003AF4046D